MARLEADYPEDVVTLVLEGYLTLLGFPFPQYSLELFSKSEERFLGVDGVVGRRIAGFKPFYMQFKKPSAYVDNGASRVSRLITDRESLKLPVDPLVLFFPLRKKRKGQFDSQHNILHKLYRRLTQKKIGDAAYVCPLFLKRSVYRAALRSAALKGWLPHHMGLNVQLLHGHVAIRPHAKVKGTNHHYSFMPDGSHLCFHSPTSLPEGSTSLVDFLAGVIGQPGSNEAFVSVDDADQKLHDFFGQDEDNKESLLPQEVFDAEPGIERWLHWGDYLKTEHRVEQFALVRWTD